MTVRPLEEHDRRGWEPLWAAYNSFYRHARSEAVTDSTFSRLCAQADGLFGLAAVDGEGRLVGLAHAVLHPSTWTTASCCYLEDLFVDRSARGGEVDAALIEAVYAEADARRPFASTGTPRSTTAQRGRSTTRSPTGLRSSSTSDDLTGVASEASKPSGTGRPSSAGSSLRSCPRTARSSGSADIGNPRAVPCAGARSPRATSR